MDAIGHDDIEKEAIEYFDRLVFLPLYPLDDHYDKLLVLWNKINARDLSRLFWEYEAEQITQRIFVEEAQRASLIVVGFYDYEIAGLIWLNHLSGEGVSSRCELGGWLPFSSRGVGSEYALRKALDYVHDGLHIQSVFMRTPWRTVKSMCDRMGLEPLAAIDRYYIRGRSQTLYIYRDDIK